MTKSELSEESWRTAAKVLQEAMECGDEKYTPQVNDHICGVVVPHLLSTAERIRRNRRK